MPHRIPNADTIAEAGALAVKSSPAVAVSAVSVMGANLQVSVYAVTIGYVLLQSAFLIYKWRRLHRKNKREDEDADAD